MGEVALLRSCLLEHYVLRKVRLNFSVKRLRTRKSYDYKVALPSIWILLGGSSMFISVALIAVQIMCARSWGWVRIP
jgi:hypothetical protein